MSFRRGPSRSLHYWLSMLVAFVLAISLAALSPSLASAEESPTADPSASESAAPSEPAVTDAPASAAPASEVPAAPASDAPASEAPASETPASDPPAPAAPQGPAPTIVPSQADYAAGTEVTLTGENWTGDDQVRVVVNDTYGASWKLDQNYDVAADGTLTVKFTIPAWFVSDYDVTAIGVQTDRKATTTFTDASVVLDQCANGTSSTQCDRWVTGALGDNNSNINEGDSVPYRDYISGLTAGQTYTIVINWDITKSGKHAIDYLTSYDRTVTGANPCDGFAWCNLASETTFPIPLDTSGAPKMETGGEFSMFGGTITAVSAYGTPVGTTCPATTAVFTGDQTRCVMVTFTASGGEAVLAWGGHIATRKDWGYGNAAVNITGNPFHMRNSAWNGGPVGNQDMSVSAAGVFYVPTMTIKKVTDPVGATQTFTFTGSPAPATGFTLKGGEEKTFILTKDQLTTYTFTENATANWDLQNLACTVQDANGGTAPVTGATAKITPKEGEAWTCTYTNKQHTGTVTLIKKVINDNGGTATANQWDLNLSQGGTVVKTAPGSETGTTYTLPVGSYGVSETGGVGGYAMTSIKCNGVDATSVTVTKGSNTTCIVTNDDKAATLKLVKEFSVANGDLSAITLTATGDGGFSHLANASADKTIKAGVTYTLSESGTGLAGFTSQGWTCDGGTQAGATIKLALDQHVTCTITNKRDQGTIELKKQWVGTPGTVDLKIGAAAGGAGVANVTTTGDVLTTGTKTVVTGTYFVSEAAAGATDLAKYSTTTACVNGSASVPVGANGAVAVGKGDAVVCTITNTRKTGTLIVKKHVVNDDGGTVTADAWTLHVNKGGDEVKKDAGSEAGTTYQLDEGTYSVSETGDVAGYAQTSIVCTGSDNNSVTVETGETRTCTITNDDIAPKLTLVKEFTGTAGDLTKITLTAAGQGGFEYAASASTAKNVKAGVTYDLSESGEGLAGYTSLGWACDGGVKQGASIKLALAADVTCTVTNKRDQGTIELEKVWVGRAGSVDLKIGQAAGGDGVASVTTTADLLTTGAKTVDTGTYFVSEAAAGTTNLAKYSTTTVCKNGSTSVPVGANGAVEVGKGDAVVCTITNTRKTGTLIVKKIVVNDDGGTAASKDWSLHVKQAGADVATSPQAGDANGTSYQLAEGTYTVSESGGVLGYEQASIVCTGSDDDSVTVETGETKICTITNDDVAPKLTLVKAFSGTAGDLAEITLIAAGEGGFEYAASASAAKNVKAGVTYDLSESGEGLAGYTSQGWACDGGTKDGATIKLGLAANVTCTITNQRDQGTIELAKVWVGRAGTVDLKIGKAAGGDGVANVTTTADLLTTGTKTVDTGTYFVSEAAAGTTNLAKYSTTTVCKNGSANVPVGANGAVAVGKGDAVVCTITNTRKTGTLIVKKHVVTDNGGTATADEWTLEVKQGGKVVKSADGSEAGTEYQLAEGTYTVSESGGVAGYAQASIVCTGSDDDSVTVETGETKICTITNDDVAPTLKLVKLVNNSQGGSAVTDDFTLTATGPAGTKVINAAGSSPVTDVRANTAYELDESKLAGYVVDKAWSCTNGITVTDRKVTLTEGQSTVCTIENKDVAPKLTLVKVVTNNDGGTAGLEDFPLSAAASSEGRTDRNLADVVSGTPAATTQTVYANTVYTLSEQTKATYGASDWSCSGGDLTGDKLTLAAGANVTCTITNDDVAPKLRLVKTVVNNDGGTVQAEDVTLTASGADRGFSGNGDTGSKVVKAGVTYTLSESNLPGYTASAWDCTGGDQTGAKITLDKITLGLGDNVTCTITNTDDTPQLKLVKVVDANDGGTAESKDFTLTATGSARGFDSASNTPSFHNVTAGVTYTLSEDGPAGYSQDGAWLCVGGQQDGNKITVPLGASVTCTVTNTDDTPTLTLVKEVTNNDGGLAGPNAFTLTAGNDAKPGRNITTPGGSDEPSDVFAGIAYTLGESGPAGYTASQWSCTGGSLNADKTAVTVALGGNAVCTIKNDDQAPTLKLVKSVTTDNGGDAVADDWTLTATGGAPDGAQPRNISTEGGSGTFETVYANTDYTLAESGGPSGYVSEGWVCTDGVKVVDGVIKLAPGQTGVVCTVTNNDVAPTLTLVKKVVNDNGGTKAAGDFDLTATASGAAADTSFTVAGDPGVAKPIVAGAGYTLSETQLAGYTVKTDWACTGGTLVDGVVTASEGADVVCTIVNTDIAPKLKLVKIVKNDHGGNAVAADFTLTADGNGDGAGLGSGISGAGGTDSKNVIAGVAYDLSETGLTGYTASAWECTGKGGTQTGASVTLALEAVVTCTITNSDVAPKLTLVKTVTNDNGGNAEPGDFKLSALNGTAGLKDVTTGSTQSVRANTAYTLSEGNLDGYTPGDWTCTGDSLSGDKVTLDEGADVTCTINNDDTAAKLQLVKVVNNNHGGNAVATDFSLTATGPAGVKVIDAKGQSAVVEVRANTAYDLAESGLDGYVLDKDWSCTNGATVVDGKVTLNEGQSSVCTIENKDQAPKLTLVKTVTNDDGGLKVPADFKLSALNGTAGLNGVTTGTTQGVKANTAYTLSEQQLTGYTAGDWSCTGATLEGNNVTLDEGANATCTIHNNDQAPKLTLVKTVTNDDGGNAEVEDFKLTAESAKSDPEARNLVDVTTGTTKTVWANASYALSEANLTGYTPGLWSCDKGVTVTEGAITLAPGADVTCTINNNDQAPKLTLVKTVTNDDGGNAKEVDFKLSALNGTSGLDKVTTGTTQAVKANTAYTLSEVNLTGYTPGSWSCTGATLEGNKVTLDEGANATCTINNDDVAPTLKLVKDVKNDDGGLAVATDFKLSATADGDRNIADAAGASDVTKAFANRAYTLSETNLAGYTPGTWSCTGATVTAGKVTLDEGANAVCTIVNDDQAPTLKLRKVVTGGTAVANDFLLSAVAEKAGRNQVDIKGGSGTATSAWANQWYTLSEKNLTGYTAGDWTCTGAEVRTVDGVQQVSLKPGAAGVCTIENTRDRGQIELVKKWVGTGAQVTLTIKDAAGATVGSQVTGANGAAPLSTGVKTVDTGTFTVSESGTNLARDYNTEIACVTNGGDAVATTGSVKVGKDDKVVCTITNTRKVGQIKVTKFHDRVKADNVQAADGEPALAGWTFFIDANGNKALDAGEAKGTTGTDGTFTFTGVETGTYSVCEVNQAGWSTKATSTCGTVTVTEGAVTAASSFKIGNYRKAGIKVTKTVKGGSIPSGMSFTFTIRSGASMTSEGTVLATGTVSSSDNTIDPNQWSPALSLDPGAYALCEVVVVGQLRPDFSTNREYGDGVGSWFSPGLLAGPGFQDNENNSACITFLVTSTDTGDAVVNFSVDNVSTGFSHTIGFWKNWTSCDGSGSQAPVLDQMIAKADDSNGNGLPDIRIGNLYIEGPNACKVAVDILDKRLVGDPAKVYDSAKAAGDPIVNSTAQLLAYELNQMLNPAGTSATACQAKAAEAANLMQRFLSYINYTGKYAYPSTNKTEQQQIQQNLLYLANILDDYNNNTMMGCSTALKLPAPNKGTTATPWVNVLPARVSSDT